MMDTYSNSGRSVKQESDRDSTDSPASDRRAAAAAVGSADAENFLEMQQQLQQLLAASSTGVTSSSAALLSPLHFLQASGATSVAGGASLPIPWNMMPQYQMMFALSGQNATGVGGDEGHVLVMPSGSSDSKGNGTVSAAQQQMLDAASLQMVLQQQLNAAAAAGGEQALAAQMAAATSAADQAQRARQAAQQQQQILQQQAAQQRQQAQQQQQDLSKPSPPRPPKKPLTPYMMFSKAIWPQVKAANTHLSSVTEIGAIIGSLWRELGAEDKLQYNEQFTKDKQRYDEELRAYLKTNGLHPSDLIKARSKKNKDITRPADNRHNSNFTQAATGAAHQQAAASRAAATSAAAGLSPVGQQLVHALVGYQSDGSASGTAGQQRANTEASAANSLPNFSQAWAGQPVQQLLAQMGLAGQVYANSDGTISVDNANLASLLALQPQLLQQAQMYSEQGQMKSPGKEVATWHQQQTSAAGSAAGQSNTPLLVQPNGLAAPTTNGSASSDDSAQYSEYFTINAEGQLVKHTSPIGGNVAEYALRISQLETELVRVQSALVERVQENERLKQELGEAFRLVTEYRQQGAAAVAAIAERSVAVTTSVATSG